MTTSQSLRICVLTVSDTRTAENDSSGDTLVERLLDAGHQLVERALDPDNIYQLRHRVSGWIATLDFQRFVVDVCYLLFFHDYYDDDDVGC